jgi:hypothetical protein
MVNDPNSFEAKFPKFIIGDTEDRTFVVHLHSPKFIAELIESEDGETFDPTFIDEPIKDASAIAKLMREV